MQSKKPYSTAKIVFTILVTFLLASVVVPVRSQAQKFKVLHTFHGRDGASPEVALVRDASGNLYGTTVGGGTGKCSKYGCGTAFKLNKSGKQVWLYNFESNDGRLPASPLLREAGGSLLGSTGEGGDENCGFPHGCGVVFTLNSAGRKEKVLYKFDGTDGVGPGGPLAIDTAGNIYGATALGVANGAVFKIDTSGNETVLYAFSGGSDGSIPEGGVIRDSEGNLYGTTQYGGVGFGDSGYGVVFMVDTAGNETVLHAFTSGSDGADPSSALIFDSEGNLYGTTDAGGSSACGGTGCGTVFKLSPNGDGTWSESILYAFCSTGNCTDGEEPVSGPLARDSSGNLYGTTYFGGAYRNCDGDACGVVFKLDTSGNETVLHSFAGGSDGAFPFAGVAIDGRGNLYGN
jgi:uncharacterized repeat protein (TIGR03803 family)